MIQNYQKCFYKYFVYSNIVKGKYFRNEIRKRRNRIHSKVDKLTKQEEEIANKFLLELVSLTRHIENVSHEGTKIGGGIFILHIIDSKDNCIMKDIVGFLNLGASTATRQVDSLVKQGLIKREIGETDRRKVHLTLTEEGKQVYKQFKNHMVRVMRNSLKTYSELQIGQAIEVFHTIVENSESNLPLKTE